MRMLSCCVLLLFLSGVVWGQASTGGTGGTTNTGGTNTGGTNTNTGGGNNINTGGGGGGNQLSGGSSQVPQGFGSGGVSENLNSAEFGERGTAIQGFGFIGDNSLPGGFFGQGQAGNAGNNNTRGQFGNAGGRAGGRAGAAGRQTQRNTQRRIRTRLVLPADFAAEYRVVAPVRLQNSLAGQFQRIDQVQANSNLALGSSRVFDGANIQVIANGRTVTLRGQVASARERKLAERIAGFEPGVSRVVNELSIAE